jgi:hypothetical protein
MTPLDLIRNALQDSTFSKRVSILLIALAEAQADERMGRLAPKKVHGGKWPVAGASKDGSL